jgi:two-component SAPR family response regulator
MRVLIVEDEFLIAMDLEDLMEQMGHQVAASVSRLDEAMKFVCTQGVDFAILDLNLRGEESFPLAEILRAHDIPFIFTSGYGAAGLVKGFENEHILQKPYQTHELKRMIEKMIG